MNLRFKLHCDTEADTLQKHLSYFKHIFRLSQLHQCDQGLLICLHSWDIYHKPCNQGTQAMQMWFESFFSYISLRRPNLRRPICLHSWHFYHKPCNQRTQGMQMYVRSKQHHTSSEMLIYRFFEASQLTELCVLHTQTMIIASTLFFGLPRFPLLAYYGVVYRERVEAYKILRRGV